MIGERTPEGWVLRVRPEGVARFGGAIFLCVWLCGWAFGEIAVLSILGGGAYSLLTGNELAAPFRKLAAPVTLGIGAFLTLWVTFWTFGGIMAIGELLRLVSSEDALTIGPGGVSIRRRRGPFTWTKIVTGVHDVHVAPKRRMLVLETPRRPVDFAPLPPSLDATAAIEALRGELHLPTAHDPGDALPEGWEEAVTPEGERVVIPAAALRHRQMLTCAALAGFAWLGALLFAWRAMQGDRTLGGAILVGTFASLFAGAALWLDRTRFELKPGSGQVTCRRRFGGTVRTLFQADRLELTSATDSDGDARFKLEGVSLAPPDPLRPGRRNRRMLAHALHDPFVPKALGAWLAGRAGVTFRDGSHRDPGGL